MSNKTILELGDVIEITTDRSVSSEDSTPETYLVTYLDEHEIELKNLETTVTLPLVNNQIQKINDQPIQEISVVYRNPLKGYALQHGLTPEKHVQLSFEDMPDKLQGEILETKNDILTILLDDTLEIIFVNFAFKGLPRDDVGLSAIELFEPTGVNKRKEDAIKHIYEFLDKQPVFQQTSQPPSGSDVPVAINIDELTRNILLHVPEVNENMKAFITRVVSEYIEHANRQHSERRQTGEEELLAEDQPVSSEPKEALYIGIPPQIESLHQEHIHKADELFEKEGLLSSMDKERAEQDNDDTLPDTTLPNQPTHRRYSLQEQINAMSDTFYASLGNKKRTSEDHRHIQTLIQRYTDLYHTYVASTPPTDPMMDSLQRFNHAFGWVCPVVAQRLKQEGKGPDEPFVEQLLQITKAFQDKHSMNDDRYQTYLLNLDKVFDGVYDKSIDTADTGGSSLSKCLVRDRVHADLAVVSHLLDTPTFQAGSSVPSVTKYLISMYKDKLIYRDLLCLVGMVTFPTSVMVYSRVFTPMTSIYEAANMLEGTNGWYMFQMWTESQTPSRTSRVQKTKPRKPLLKEKEKEKAKGRESENLRPKKKLLVVDEDNESSLAQEEETEEGEPPPSLVTLKTRKNKPKQRSAAAATKPTKQQTKRRLPRRQRSASAIHTVYVGGEEEEEDSPFAIVDKSKINHYTLLAGGENDSLVNLERLISGMLDKERQIEPFLESLPAMARGVGFSIYKLCRQLEPFQIYYDRLTTKQWQSLENILEQRIHDYNHVLEKNKQAFHSVETQLTKLSAATNQPRNLLQEVAPKDETFVSHMTTVYQNPLHFPHLWSKLSPEELLVFLLQVDGAEFFTFALCANKLDREIVREKAVPYRNHRSQASPEAELLAVTVNPPPPDPALNPIEGSNDSPSPPPDSTSLTKDFAAMRLDKEPTIPFREQPQFGGLGGLPAEAPQQDEASLLPPHVSRVTVLPLGSKGKEYSKNIPIAKFYLERQDLQKDNGRTILSTLLPEPRDIVNGDHAILLQGGSDTLTYFIRENNHWREDVTLQPQARCENPAMFCNLGLTCMRDFSNKSCVSMKSLSNYMVQHTLAQGSTQVNQKFLKYLQENEVKQLARSRAISTLYYDNLLLHDRNKFALGLKKKAYDLAPSKYQDLFLAILSEKSFEKRQLQLIQFCMKYTRPHNSQNNLEVPYWRYSLEENVPLVPTSLFQVASLYNKYVAFRASGGQNDQPKFEAAVDALKKEIGIVSDDGSAVIDKHTGFKFADYPLDSSEDVDEEGNILKHHDLLRDDLEDKGPTGGWVRTPSTRNEKQETLDIHTIVETLSQKMGIHLTNQLSFIVRNVRNVLLHANMRGLVRNKHLMYLTLGMMVIAIQTSIPTVASIKTIPRCKEIFLGYPLLEQGMGTIHYVACVVMDAKLKNPPWNVLPKKVEGVEQMIKYAIDSDLRALVEVQSKIYEKKYFLDAKKHESQEEEEEEVEVIQQKEPTLRKWTTFLPTQPTRLSKTNDVQSLQKHQMDAIKARPTPANLDLLFSKIYDYTLGIQSAIQTVVAKEELLLKTAWQVPFVQNACCVDTSQHALWNYFTKHQPILQSYLSASKTLTERIYWVNREYAPQSMLSEINTKRKYPPVDPSISQTTMYAVFIYQAKQDILNDVGKLPEDTEAKTNDGVEEEEEEGVVSSSSRSSPRREHLVKVYDTLEENIRHLENAKFSFTEKDVDLLLKDRFQQGMLPPETVKPEVTSVELLYLLPKEMAEIQASLREIAEADTGLLPSEFVNGCLAAFQGHPKPDALSKLRTYLHQRNEKFLAKVKTYWSSFLSAKEVERSTTVLEESIRADSFVRFDLFLDMTQEFIDNLGRVYPSMIQNKSNEGEEEVEIPEYWKLSKTHQEDLSMFMLSKSKLLESLYGIAGMAPMVNAMIADALPVIRLLKKIRTYYNLQQTPVSVASAKKRKQALEPPPPTPAVLLTSETMQLLFKYFVYILYEHYLLLSQAHHVQAKDVCDMMDKFFELFLQQKEMVNQDVADISQAVLHLQNKQKNKRLAKLSRMSNQERQVSKIHQLLKLGEWGAQHHLRKYSATQYDLDDDTDDDLFASTPVGDVEMDWGDEDDRVEAEDGDLEFGESEPVGEDEELGNDGNDEAEENETEQWKEEEPLQPYAGVVVDDEALEDTEPEAAVAEEEEEEEEEEQEEEKRANPQDNEEKSGNE